MTKYKGKALECATLTMLSALNYIEENKFKAEDIDFYEILNSNFLSARTIIFFQGGIEYEIRIMISALLGMKSEICSDKYHYILSFDLIRFLKKCEKNNICCRFNVNIYDYNYKELVKN